MFLYQLQWEILSVTLSSSQLFDFIEIYILLMSANEKVTVGALDNPLVACW